MVILPNIPPNGTCHRDEKTENVWRKLQDQWKYVGISKNPNGPWKDVVEFIDIPHKLDISTTE